MTDENLDPVLIDIPLPIITPRFLLRPPQAGDGSALFDAKIESWDELAKWMPWAEGQKEDQTADTDEILCRKAYAKYILREDLMLLVWDIKAEKIVASTGLHRFDWKTRIFEIGYWVRTSETGKGVATEIANILTRYAFGALNANKVTIYHAGGNVASGRVAQKLGFDLEGVEKKCHPIAGQGLVDNYCYGRLSTEGLPELDVKWG